MQYSNDFGWSSIILQSNVIPTLYHSCLSWHRSLILFLLFLFKSFHSAILSSLMVLFQLTPQLETLGLKSKVFQQYCHRHFCTHLQHCHLQHCHLQHCHLQHCNLQHCNLQQCHHNCCGTKVLGGGKMIHSPVEKSIKVFSKSTGEKLLLGIFSRKNLWNLFARIWSSWPQPDGGCA